MEVEGSQAPSTAIDIDAAYCKEKIAILEQEKQELLKEVEANAWRTAVAIMGLAIFTVPFVAGVTHTSALSSFGFMLILASTFVSRGSRKRKRITKDYDAQIEALMQIQEETNLESTEGSKDEGRLHT